MLGGSRNNGNGVKRIMGSSNAHIGPACRTALLLLVIGGVGSWSSAVRAQSSAPPGTAAPQSSMERLLAELPTTRREGVAESAAKEAEPDFRAFFDKHIARIRMLDGIELYTEIYTPRNHPDPLPIIYERSPYGLSPDSHGFAAALRKYPELIKEGYIFAFQDSRGRGDSGGQFVTGGPMR